MLMKQICLALAAMLLGLCSIMTADAAPDAVLIGDVNRLQLCFLQRCYLRA